MLVQKLSKREVQKILRPAAMKYLALRARYEVLREVVDARHAVILAARPIVDESGATITNSRDLYLAAEGQEGAVAAAYSAFQAADRATGWKGSETCPALCAETEMIDANRELIEAAGPLLDGLTYDDVLCQGIDFLREMTKTLCGLAIS